MGGPPQLLVSPLQILEPPLQLLGIAQPGLRSVQPIVQTSPTRREITLGFSDRGIGLPAAAARPAFRRERGSPKLEVGFLQRPVALGTRDPAVESTIEHQAGQTG